MTPAQDDVGFDSLSAIADVLSATGCGSLSRLPILPRESDNMRNLISSVKRFLVSEDGPTAVEYAVMLALIIVVCLTAIQAVGTNANNKFNQVQNALT